MTIHKALHPRDDIDRLYMAKKGGKGLASIENFVEALQEYVKKSKERLITAANNSRDNISRFSKTTSRKQK